MCDYSLQAFKSRSARVGDRLETKRFSSGSTGLIESGGCGDEAVCLLPGTEVEFAGPIALNAYFVPDGDGMVLPRVARFRQINKDCAYAHHDAMEFPNGEQVLVHHMIEGQRLTVLQLPAVPKTAEESKEQERLAVVG